MKPRERGSPFELSLEEEVANSVSVSPKCARLQDESLFRNYSLFHSPTLPSLPPSLPPARPPAGPGTLRPPTRGPLFRSHFATLPSQLHLLEPDANAESYIGVAAAATTAGVGDGLAAKIE